MHVLTRKISMAKVVCLLWLLLFLIVSGFGCSKTPSPDQVVTEFLEKLKQWDYEALPGYFAEEKNIRDLESSFEGALRQEEDAFTAEAYRKAFSEKLDFKVISSKTEGNTAEVKVEITSINMPRVVADVVGKALPMAFAAAFGDEKTRGDVEKMTEQMFLNAITDPNAPVATTSAVFPLKKVDGQWKISGDEEFGESLVNALTGNLGKALEVWSNPALVALGRKAFAEGHPLGWRYSKNLKPSGNSS
ncbi:MAG TPA: DUF4878 domain-containing protein [Clostridia bacterium]|nr:DUF4878 domain-containing protein [Clostridia bacterium]